MPPSRLNILILHAIDDFGALRQSTLRHILALQRYAPEHRYFYQHIRAPATRHLRSIPFDVIVLDASFLCWRWVRPRHHFERAKERYAWLADSPAVKLAFPQDDYDHATVLDDWLADYNVQIIYAVCPDRHDILYPRNFVRAEITFALTGYIDEDDIALYESYSRPFASRYYDVGYRVRALPPWFGSFGLLKSDLGRVFDEAVGGKLRTSISDRPEATLTGEAWPHFLGDCRYALGSEGGSSIIDADGTAREACEAYMRAHPDATARDVITAVLPEDGRYVFAMPTPRLFEIAMAGCCPILLEGEYFGWLKPDVHYLSVRQDFSNIGAVIDRLGDHAAAQVMVKRYRNALLGRPELHYRGHVGTIFAAIWKHLAGRETGRKSDDVFAALIQAHRRDASEELQDILQEYPRLLDYPGAPDIAPPQGYKSLLRRVAARARRAVGAA